MNDVCAIAVVKDNLIVSSFKNKVIFEVKNNEEDTFVTTYPRFML